jgi:hypothetical protein
MLALFQMPKKELLLLSHVHWLLLLLLLHGDKWVRHGTTRHTRLGNESLGCHTSRHHALHTRHHRHALHALHALHMHHVHAPSHARGDHHSGLHLGLGRLGLLGLLHHLLGLGLLLLLLGLLLLGLLQLL